MFYTESMLSLDKIRMYLNCQVMFSYFLLSRKLEW